MLLTETVEKAEIEKTPYTNAADEYEIQCRLGQERIDSGEKNRKRRMATAIMAGRQDRQ